MMKKVMRGEEEYKGLSALGHFRDVLRTLDICCLGGFRETNNRLGSAERHALICVFEASLRLVWRIY